VIKTPGPVIHAPPQVIHSQGLGLGLGSAGLLGSSGLYGSSALLSNSVYGSSLGSSALLGHGLSSPVLGASSLGGVYSSGLHSGSYKKYW